MHLRRQDFASLSAMAVKTLIAASLVRRTDDFDRGHKPVLAAPSTA
jgi:hypothetical protein